MKKVNDGEIILKGFVNFDGFGKKHVWQLLGQPRSVLQFFKKSYQNTVIRGSLMTKGKELNIMW